MGYFQVRYDSRVVIYDRRGFIRLATGWLNSSHDMQHPITVVYFGADLLLEFVYEIGSRYSDRDAVKKYVT